MISAYDECWWIRSVSDEHTIGVPLSFSGHRTPAALVQMGVQLSLPIVPLVVTRRNRGFGSISALWLPNAPRARFPDLK